MQIDNLDTPLYLLREGTEFKWPTHKLFYILAKNGYFMCRNHPFYQSAVALTEEGHPDLADYDEFCCQSYPKLPQALLEKIVGFFGAVEKEHSSEAYVLLGWDLVDKEIKMLVPKQEVSCTSAEYELPNYPNNWILIGDVHSHSTMPAYSSTTDKEDEAKRSGLHIVVGKIDKEPPEFHIEVVVDGSRFKVKDHDALFEGYERRDKDIPEDWMAKVTKKKWTWSNSEYGGGSYYGDYGGMGGMHSDYSGSDTYPHNRRQSKKEKKDYKKWWKGLIP